MNDSIDEAAQEQGYVRVHRQETGSESGAFALIIYMKTTRTIGEKDRSYVYRAAEQIYNGYRTVSEDLDPEGPAKRQASRDQVARIYTEAGVRAIYMEEIKNGYSDAPLYRNRPWFRVTSGIGHVVIGWRRSVLSIDWKDTVVKESGLEIFPEETVTLSETGIHADDEHRAAAYIRRLHEVAVEIREGRSRA